jgi:hypothetical protein
MPDWSLSVGWAHAIRSHTETGESVLDAFFDLIDEYRQLRPTVVLHAQLGPHHQPTGRRVVIGHAGRMPRPDAVTVLQYQPAHLHVFRFTYPHSFSEEVVFGENSTVETTLDDARAWLADELDLGPDDWSAREDAGEQGAAR